MTCDSSPIFKVCRTILKLWVRNRRTVRSDDLPLTTLPDEHICDMPSEPMLARFVAEADTLPSFDYGGIAVNAHACVVNDVFERPILPRIEVCQFSGLIRAFGVEPASQSGASV